MRLIAALMPVLLAACAVPGPGAGPEGAAAPSGIATVEQAQPAETGLDLACDDGQRRRVVVGRDAAGVPGVRLDLDGQLRFLRRVTPPHLPAGLLLFEDVQAGWRWSVNQRVSVLVRHGGRSFVRIVARCTSALPLMLP